MRWAVAVVVSAALLAGCSDDEADAERSGSTDGGPSASASSETPTSGSPTAPSASPTDSPSPPKPPRFDRDAAMRTVRHLANGIGPREAASPDFRRAAVWVEGRLDALGFDTERRPLRVPEGVSWGVPVEAGRTWNVVATPPDFDPGRPYVIVGAHLDTVPQAPGAEDNASGVAVLLELARLAAAAPTRHSVMFVAFGGEEPRGDGDDWHHFGSREFVDRMTGQERRALRGMVSLDRVGVGRVVPVCSGGLEPPRLRRALLRTAAGVGIATEPCENQASDHWSFDKAGLPAARLGSTPYAEYHSEADRPRVVRPAQLDRVGRLMWAWLGRR